MRRTVIAAVIGIVIALSGAPQAMAVTVHHTPDDFQVVRGKSSVGTVADLATQNGQELTIKSALIRRTGGHIVKWVAQFTGVPQTLTASDPVEIKWVGDAVAKTHFNFLRISDEEPDPAFDSEPRSIGSFDLNTDGAAIAPYVNDTGRLEMQITAVRKLTFTHGTDFLEISYPG